MDMQLPYKLSVNHDTHLYRASTYSTEKAAVCSVARVFTLSIPVPGNSAPITPLAREGTDLGATTRPLTFLMLM